MDAHLVATGRPVGRHPERVLRLYVDPQILRDCGEAVLVGKICLCWKFPSSFFLAGGKYVYCFCDGKAIDVHLLLQLLIWVKLPWQSLFNSLGMTLVFFIAAVHDDRLRRR